MKTLHLRSLAWLVITILVLGVSCAKDNIQNQKGGLSYTFQIKYDSTVTIYSSSDKPVFKISFVKVIDGRCNCTLCYPAGTVYAYFLVMYNSNHADTLKLSRPGCLTEDLTVNNPNMDIKTLDSQKFGFVNIHPFLPSPQSEYVAKIILIP
ncbi:MAG: hypothetical protein JST37_01255 [Bacteroidetes bacterium]|nr:hypothetical protein [Bacteroidota bacterium]